MNLKLMELIKRRWIRGSQTHSGYVNNLDVEDESVMMSVGKFWHTRVGDCVCTCAFTCVHYFLRWVVRAAEVAAVVARELSASLHHPGLQPAAMGALVPAHLSVLHSLDSPLLLPHGLDGTKSSQLLRLSCLHTNSPLSLKVTVFLC